MAILANLSVLGLALIALLVWGFARVLDAPRWAGRLIAFVAVLIMMLGQLTLPASAPFRQSVSGSIELLLLVGLLAVPVLAYRWVLRRARARHVPPGAGDTTGPDGRPAPAAAAGRVTGQTALIARTDALAADLNQTLSAGIPADGFGLIHRAPDGTLIAGLVAQPAAGGLLVEPVWWQTSAGSVEVIDPLLAALDTQARARGIRVLRVATAQPVIASGFTARGYARLPSAAPAPAALLERVLT